MNNDDYSFEDDDHLINIEAAASMRQLLMKQVRRTPDPINQALMELEHLGANFGIETLMDYDSDTSDLEEL